MRFQPLSSMLLIVLGVSGCLPSSDGETEPFFSNYRPEFSSCSEVAACADSSSAENCIARATYDAGAEFSTVNQCYLACNGDEPCENDCLPLVSSCFCGDEALYLDGTCTAPSEVPWRVYVASYDVSEWCGIDGFNTDEFFHRGYLDGDYSHVSSESDCYSGRAKWPLSEAWSYASSQAFSLDIIESDYWDDDEYVLGFGWRDEQGNQASIPLELLLAGFWGDLQVAGAAEIGVTR